MSKIKLKAKENFSLYSRFTEIRNLKRFDLNQNQEGRLFKFDEFEVEKDLADYLLNETINPVNRAVVELIEIIPEKKAEKEVKPSKKTDKNTRKNKK